MLEILVILAILLGMAKAKPRRRRRMGAYIKGNVDESLSLGTLAAGTLIADTWDDSVSERTRISSVVAIWALDVLTAPQGPIMVGVAHSDYTDAEIEEVIENTGTWDRGDKISQERAKRLVRVVGKFGQPSAAGEVDQVLNDGKPIKTKLNWILNSGDTLKMWAYNNSGSALSGTVPVVRVNGHANLWEL